MTLTVAAGAIEYDEVGDFQELRTAGVQLRRESPELLILDTTAGTQLRIRSAMPIMVTAEEKGPR